MDDEVGHSGSETVRSARAWFIALWLTVCALKLWLAARLPLFVDEAFYWQEGQHLAWAYSDLPGLTAWLTRIGVELGGTHPLALRMPFLLLAAILPWLIVRISEREFGELRGWQAGLWALLLPLAGSLGMLALPDVPLAFATVLCLDAGARLLRRVDTFAVIELACGLVVGALSHYRFAAVIGVGLIALLCVQQGRQVLREPKVWLAILVGALAWLPLILWNLDNADAGIRFQLIDRHPWTLHADGGWFVLIQMLLVTPLLLLALMLVAVRGWRDVTPASRYFALLGGLTVLGFFALGFFADRERVSFHWPLPGYLALLPLLPLVLATWSHGLRRATWVLAVLGLSAVFGYYTIAATPSLRAKFAAEKFHPVNFAGWEEVANVVRDLRAGLPPQTRLIADNFKLGAQLGFALDDANIAVLDHPINHKHGRAPQLRDWGFEKTGIDQPTLLVVSASEVNYKDLLRYYHTLCERLGPLPPPLRVINADHGRQRFLLFVLSGEKRTGVCTSPAMAYVDAPGGGAIVGRTFVVSGWAFKDGIGIAEVEITLDGAVVAKSSYGHAQPHVAEYWKISTDPYQPHVGFAAHLDASSLKTGRHWLGLRLQGHDGSVEAWPEQPIDIRD